MNQGNFGGFPGSRGDPDSTTPRRPWGYINGSALPGMPSRGVDTWYQNTESEPILVIVQAQQPVNTGYEVYLASLKLPATDITYTSSGVASRAQQAVSLGLVYPSSSGYFPYTFEVPPGWWYFLKPNNAGFIIQNWTEYRRQPG